MKSLFVCENSRHIIVNNFLEVRKIVIVGIANKLVKVYGNRKYILFSSRIYLILFSINFSFMKYLQNNYSIKVF